MRGSALSSSSTTKNVIFAPFEALVRQRRTAAVQGTRLYRKGHVRVRKGGVPPPPFFGLLLIFGPFAHAG